MRSHLKRNEITFSGVQLQSSKKGQASLKVANRCLKAIRWSSHSNGPNIVSLAALFKGQWSILKTSNISNFDTLSFHVKKFGGFVLNEFETFVRLRFICSRNLSRKIEKIDTISNVRTHTLTLSWLRLDPLVVVAVVVLVAPPWLALESFEEAPMVLRGDSMASLEALHNWHSYRIMRNGQKDEWWPPKSTCHAQLIDGAKYKINGSFEKIFLATNDGTKSRSEKRGPKGHRSNKKLCPFYQW